MIHAKAHSILFHDTNPLGGHFEPLLRLCSQNIIPQAHMQYNKLKRFIREHKSQHTVNNAKRKNVQHVNVYIENIKQENPNRKQGLRLCHLKQFIRDAPNNTRTNTTHALTLCHLKKFIGDSPNNTMTYENGRKNT